MAGTKAEKNRERILQFVTGLLYFHGAREFEGLYQEVKHVLSLNMKRRSLQEILDREACDEDSPYDFWYDKGYYTSVFLDDVEWLLEERARRDYLPFRPVTEEEARLAAEEEYLSLWEPPVKEFHRLVQGKLKDFFRVAGDEEEDARLEILEIQENYLNGMPHMELVQGVLERVEFSSQEEVQPFLDALMKMLNHTPQWILKGWTAAHVFENYEKEELQPLPEGELDFAGDGWREKSGQMKLDEFFEEEKPGEKRSRDAKNRDEASGGDASAGFFSGLDEVKGTRSTVKVGRNEPCPCGSGKKYKKCCGSPLTEEEKSGVGSGGAVTGASASAGDPRPSSKSPAAEGKSEGLEQREPALQEWEALFRAAVEFKEIEPWGWMDDDNLFGVVDPETGETAYCCIMGALGDVFGLNAYLGSEGLDVCLDMLNGEIEVDDEDLLLRQKCLSATFDNKEDLDDRELALIKQLGFKFRGKNQWPMFRSFEPGYFPWYLNAWQCRFLTHVLQQAREVALNCREDKSLLEREDGGACLVRVPVPEQAGQSDSKEEAAHDTQKAPALRWENRYPDFPEYSPKVYPTVRFQDELRVRKLRLKRERGEIKLSSAWEADTMRPFSPVQDKRGERPYYPVVLVVLDASGPLVVCHYMARSLEDDGQLYLEKMVETMESSGAMPTCVVVEREETYYLLEDLCEKLDIHLEIVEDLKFLPEIRENITGRGTGD